MLKTARTLNRGILLPAVACAALAIGATSCSGAKDSATDGKNRESGKEQAFAGSSPDEIADKAVAATKKAQSLRLTSETNADGKSASADYLVDTKGSCQGTNTVQDAKAEMRRIGPDTFIKGNQSYWEAAAKQQGGEAKAQQSVEAFKDKWVKLPASGAKAAQAGCDKDAILAALDNDKSERQGMARGADAQVNGQNTATLTKTTAEGETLTVHVATEGEPYILKIDGKGAKGNSTTSFADFNKPVEPQAPPADEVVDAAKPQ
ncbi:hypothetical protein ACGFXC_35710 [Streptomyces sp. NPDC048507]|uniref:hypothetical protein n=1 Tax=Streptomyces sp. NPDC048507 TaxID=3365560 RepID=UPI003720289D